MQFHRFNPFIIYREREAPPRFAQPGNFEYEFALRWKALDEMERQLKEQSEKTIAAAREKLELEMESAIHDHKTMMMKQGIIALSKIIFLILDLYEDKWFSGFWINFC